MSPRLIYRQGSGKGYCVPRRAVIVTGSDDMLARRMIYTCRSYGSRMYCGLTGWVRCGIGFL